MQHFSTRTTKTWLLLAGVLMQAVFWDFCRVNPPDVSEATLIWSHYNRSKLFYMTPLSWRARDIVKKEIQVLIITINRIFCTLLPFSFPWSHSSLGFFSLPTESRTRASIAVPSFEHATSFKRPHSTISNSSTSSSSSQSSSSLLGSLNLHLYSSPSHPHTHPYPMTSVPSFAQWPYDCIEEDELEQDTGSQPSMSEWLLY